MKQQRPTTHLAALTAATLVLMGATTMATGCRRHYQVQYARVPVDTIAARDSSMAEQQRQEDEQLFGSDDHVFETPDEVKFRTNDPHRRQNQKELDEYLKESGLHFDDDYKP
jgi:uncharacterized protein HemX